MTVDKNGTANSETQKSEMRKQAVFREIKKMKSGKIISRDAMKEYVHALHDYKRWISSLYVDSALIKFSSFFLENLKISTLEIHWEKYLPKSEEDRLKAREKIEAFKEYLKNSDWYPPIVFDPIENKIIDGNHRALALKEMGFDKVFAFVGIKSPAYDILQLVNFKR